MTAEAVILGTFLCRAGFAQALHLLCLPTELYNCPLCLTINPRQNQEIKISFAHICVPAFFSPHFSNIINPCPCNSPPSFAILTLISFLPVPPEQELIVNLLVRAHRFDKTQANCPKDVILQEYPAQNSMVPILASLELPQQPGTLCAFEV